MVQGVASESRSSNPSAAGNFAVAATAVFALAWAVARAHVQSITIDEAQAYLSFASAPAPFLWYPAADNHVLNTMLIRLFTSIFGTYHLTVRLPALLGAALYISASWLAVTAIASRTRLRWPLLVCLVYNPFVFDYLVAARGYSLALGCFLWILALPCWLYLRRAEGAPLSLEMACCLCSLAAGLSVAANFSFGLACAAAMLGVLVWAWSRTNDPLRRARLFACCLLPAAAAFIVLCGSVILGMRRGQFIAGVSSLAETFGSLPRLSLDRVNPELVNPLLRNAAARLGPIALTLTAAFLVASLVLAAVPRARRAKAPWSRHAVVGASLVGVFVLTVLLHLALKWALKLPLPAERTALFFVPLTMVFTGVVAAAPGPGQLSRYAAAGLTASLMLLAIYFLCCMRLSYFQLWIWDADVRQAYDAAAWYNHEYGVRDVPCSWHFAPSLNFYRAIGHESFDEFKSPDPYPPGRRVYILLRAFDRPFIDSQHLRVVYYGERSDIAVAVNPKLLARPAPCVNAVTNP